MGNVMALRSALVCSIKIGDSLSDHWFKNFGTINSVLLAVCALKQKYSKTNDSNHLPPQPPILCPSGIPRLCCLVSSKWKFELFPTVWALQLTLGYPAAIPQRSLCGPWNEAFEYSPQLVALVGALLELSWRKCFTGYRFGLFGASSYQQREKIPPPF